MIKLGIDLGSRFIKAVINDGDDTRSVLADTIDFYKRRIIRNGTNISIDMSFLDIDIANASILATGYGRNLLQFDNLDVISEIKAHFYGAQHQIRLSGADGDNFTLLDVGGQDCKIIDVKNGYIDDFTMNDKCAASTGRFMEQAAKTLDIPSEKFNNAIDCPVALSDTCAVFCETELIGLLARGESEMHLAAGVNLSIARRLAPVIKKYKPRVLYTSGGGASPALMYFISDLTAIPAIPLPEQQFNGAIGCISYMNKNIPVQLQD